MTDAARMSSNTLSPEQVSQYRRDGFLFPIDVLSTQEAGALRQELEALERETPDGSLPKPIHRYMRVNCHYVMTLASRLVTDPRILDPVAGILGDDLLVWGCEFFIKEPGTGAVVTWHQDLTYWGLGETDEEVTAWLALSDVTVASGCMRFVAGSHRNNILGHKDTYAENNLLSRGQELAVDVDEEDAVDVVLKPGQLSLHHGRMFHASGPNVSDDRRIGVAIRYVTPEVKQLVAERDYAMLARGVDGSGNWIHIDPPTRNFAPAELETYETILADQTIALGQGATGNIGIYAGVGSSE